MIIIIMASEVWFVAKQHSNWNPNALLCYRQKGGQINNTLLILSWLVYSIQNTGRTPVLQSPIEETLRGHKLYLLSAVVTHEF